MSFDPTDEEEELFPETESKTDSDADESASDEKEEPVEKASKAARKLEPIVLAHVLGPKYQPVKPRVIAKQLKLPSEQHKGLKLAIKRIDSRELQPGPMMLKARKLYWDWAHSGG